jgi:hypothetical protein
LPALTMKTLRLPMFEIESGENHQVGTALVCPFQPVQDSRC